MEIGLGPGDFVSDGKPGPVSKRGRSPLPNFRSISIVAKRLDASRCLSPADFVLDGDPVPPPQKGSGAPHKFSAHVYCGQMAGWIKMPLGMKVGLIPGDCVRWDPAPPHKGSGAPSPIFGPFLSWPNGWMHQDATWYGGRPIVVKWLDG